MVILSKIKEFVDFWYVAGSKNYYNFVKESWNTLERELGVLPNIYNWYRPLFQDDDYIGRILGPVFRTFRIFIGFVVYAVVGAVFLSIYSVLFFLPVLVLYMILQNLIWLF